MPTVRTTLTKFLKFLKGLEDGTVKDKAYTKIKKTLRISLDRNVFGHMQHEGNVFEIPTQTDLELLIMGGGHSHKPGSPREAHYNKEYLRKKRRFGLQAHEWMQKGFKEGTEVLKQQDRVIIRTPAAQTTVRGFNYGPLHESKKSVLKYAFLSSWQQIVKDIVETYVDELR